MNQTRDTVREFTLVMDQRDIEEVGNLILGLEHKFSRMDELENNFANDIFLDLLRQIEGQV